MADHSRIKRYGIDPLFGPRGQFSGIKAIECFSHSRSALEDRKPRKSCLLSLQADKLEQRSGITDFAPPLVIMVVGIQGIITRPFASLGHK